MSIAYVITTIQSPSPGVTRIATQTQSSNEDFLVVIGDRKTPQDWSCSGAEFLSLAEQARMNLELVHHIPTDSYARKMLGYLVAAEAGADWIRETDDDNLPNDQFFSGVPDCLVSQTAPVTVGWFNPYTYFSDRFVWPRGFPLSLIKQGTCGVPMDSGAEVAPPFILQAVADGDPDVDAIYRLSAHDTSSIEFHDRDPLALPSGVWSPFNSQATTWPRELFALMYLPVTCTFRMTDIWRSFVVQRLLPGLGGTLVFTAATVHQDRNEHDLLADFEQEVPGYLGTEKIRALLESTVTQGGKANVLSDLRTLYKALVDGGFLASEELPVLDAWIEDVRRLELAS